MALSIGHDLHDFYPTPRSLAEKMLSKVKEVKGSDFHIRRILEPSAGKGDLIEHMTGICPNDSGFFSKPSWRRAWDRAEVFAIEIDEDLQATLRGKRFTVIDSDFLQFAGPDKFDLIIMNPPFSDGARHLLKAIEIMYRGQIVCLLNAETLRNPCNRVRRELAEKLNELGAEIEYVKGAFMSDDVERKSDVEVAIVSIEIDRMVDSGMFDGVDDEAEEINIKDHITDEDEQFFEVSTGRRIGEMVAEHDQIVRYATEAIIEFYRFRLGNRRKLGQYVNIDIAISDCITNPEVCRTPVTAEDKEAEIKSVQYMVNKLAANVRKDFWRKTMDLPDVTRRLTHKKKEEFNHRIEERSNMAFTEANIRSFVLNIINGYEATLRDAVVKLFNRFSSEHSWSESPFEKNIHYYNGWKTNKAWKVNKRIIVPCWYTAFWSDTWNSWKLNHDTYSELRDICIVMNYFDGMAPHYNSVADMLNVCLDRSRKHCIKPQTSSTYFEKIIAHKKGTLHLTFRDDDILRRFNIEAAKGKGWLPEDYGHKPYKMLDADHRSVVDSFEGEKLYDENLGRTGIACAPTQPAIEGPKEEEQIGLFEAA